ITTRELARMIKRSGINFTRLPDEDYDRDIVHDATGAGHIFGVTGGVMEAAIRTVYYVLEGKELEGINYMPARGLEGIKEGEVTLQGKTIKIAVASGMKNAKVLLDQIREGKSPYTFIEIMGCPGGCINGGGQPYVRDTFMPNEDIDIYDKYLQLRSKALYSEDERAVHRQSHNNPDIQTLYKEYLGEPNSHKAHELLHTTYKERVRFD
ncbi:MAG: iron hydrogenase small subunit, partial [Firmicutes bacterium]|nr:iron hydrogenase small subunit [Bacillota bacterium]